MMISTRNCIASFLLLLGAVLPAQADETPRPSVLSSSHLALQYRAALSDQRMSDQTHEWGVLPRAPGQIVLGVFGEKALQSNISVIYYLQGQLQWVNKVQGQAAERWAYRQAYVGFANPAWGQFQFGNSLHAGALALQSIDPLYGLTGVMAAQAVMGPQLNHVQRGVFAYISAPYRHWQMGWTYGPEMRTHNDQGLYQSGAQGSYAVSYRNDQWLLLFSYQMQRQQQGQSKRIDAFLLGARYQQDNWQYSALLQYRHGNPQAFAYAFAPVTFLSMSDLRRDWSAQLGLKYQWLKAHQVALSVGVNRAKGHQDLHRFQWALNAAYAWQINPEWKLFARYAWMAGTIKGRVLAQGALQATSTEKRHLSLISLGVQAQF